jgi:hypothetical protein
MDNVASKVWTRSWLEFIVGKCWRKLIIASTMHETYNIKLV